MKSEWQNLKRFAKWGIPTAEVVAWGLEHSGFAYARSAMITRELPNTRDLSDLADNHDPLLKDRAWVDCVSRQLAHCTKTMHATRKVVSTLLIVGLLFLVGAVVRQIFWWRWWQQARVWCCCPVWSPADCAPRGGAAQTGCSG